MDYDPRVPGAGTFAAVFYSFGEIMLHQKKAWNGPVYSEGNYHCFYMGLTDGNYGQDQSYRPAENPWLVDFDLRKMHDLGCNFGMGNMEMFYANVKQPHSTQEERDAELDRFLAATVAFGHPGFLVMEGGMGNAMRSYYMLQQLHSRYCLTNAIDIRYADANGALLDTTRAVASGAYKRSQVVTRYADGTITAANGSKTDRLVMEAFGRKLDLPPNGYAGWTKDGAIEVLSSDRIGQRCDYAATPAYLYVDGRGKFARFDRAAGNGVGVCRILPEGKYEVIPLKNAECGFAVNAASAVALDKAGQEVGPAELRVARGLTYVMPASNAFSYLLSGKGTGRSLRSERAEVIPAERAVVRGKDSHEVTIPADAKPGQRLWFQFEDAWIDFTVVPFTEARLAVSNQLILELTPHLPKAAPATVTLAGQTQTASLSPEKSLRLEFPFVTPERESTSTVSLAVTAGEFRHTESWQLMARRTTVAVVPMPEKFQSGQGLRKKAETSVDAASGAIVHTQSLSCGEVSKRGLFMHPPYKGGTGYTFALYEAVSLPRAPLANFRCDIGKQDGSDRGDGILFRVLVLDAAGKETVVAEKQWAEHAWTTLEADLSRWAGQTIQIKLVADVGPADNSGGDWACWANTRLESQEAVMQVTVGK